MSWAKGGKGGATAALTKHHPQNARKKEKKNKLKAILKGLETRDEGDVSEEDLDSVIDDVKHGRR